MAKELELRVDLVALTLRERQLQVLLEACADRAARMWRLPGRPLQPGRSLDETAELVLQPSCSAPGAYLEQLYTYGDPRRVPEKRVISVAYMALVPGDAALVPPGSDWHPVQQVPPLAYDHAEILEYALRRLRYKLEYTAVGFQLLPEEFTLSELQQTYEIILGEPLDKRNFRRRILAASVIEPTGRKRTGEGRPARLYRYKPDAVAEVKARRLFP